VNTNKTTRGEKYQTTGEEKTSNQRVALIQILKLQKQLDGKNHHIPININTECQWTQLSHQKTLFGKLD
jgi:hypothetical protein